MIQIYTGNGKGKTTSAFGLAMRASGQGYKVIIFQFLKPKKLVCGEETAAKKIRNIKIVKFKQIHPIFVAPVSMLKAQREIKKSMQKAILEVKKAIFGKKYNVVILDEIINIIDQGFSRKKEFIGLIKKAPGNVELVLTGRGDISEIEPYADYVTIMIDKKHPFRQYVNARRGMNPTPCG